MQDNNLIVSNGEDEKELELDVAEYKKLEKSVADDFLLGLLSLGKVLKVHRDKWKPKRKYLDYLKRVGRAVSTTNQMIRLYEYSVNSPEKFKQLDITNWNKVNIFLSVPDELKDKFIERVNSSDVEVVDTNEFSKAKDSVVFDSNDIKDAEEVDDKVLTTINDAQSTMDDSNAPKDVFTVVSDEVQDTDDFSSSDYDIKIARGVIKSLNENGVGDFSDECISAVMGFLALRKAEGFLSEAGLRGKSALSKSEKSFWKKQMFEKLQELYGLI